MWLSDAVSPGDGLIINSRIPMWRDDIYIRIGLQVESFRSGVDLCEQNIRTNVIDVLHTNVSRNASIDRCDREAATAKKCGQEVNFAVIVTEDKFASVISTFAYFSNNSK